MTNRKKCVMFNCGFRKKGDIPGKENDMFAANLIKSLYSDIRIALPESDGKCFSFARAYKISELRCIDRWKQL